MSLLTTVGSNPDYQIDADCLCGSWHLFLPQNKHIRVWNINHINIDAMNKEQVLLITLRHGVVCAARPVSKENAIKEEREAAKRFINLVSGRQGNVTYADLHRYKNFSEIVTIDEYGEEFTTRFQIVDLNDIKREYTF